MTHNALRLVRTLARSSGSVTAALLLAACATEPSSPSQQAGTAASAGTPTANVAASPAPARSTSDRRTTASTSLIPSSRQPSAGPEAKSAGGVPRRGQGGQSVPDEVWPDFAWAKPGETIDVYAVWNRLEVGSIGNFKTGLEDLNQQLPKDISAGSADQSTAPHGIVPIRITVAPNCTTKLAKLYASDGGVKPLISRAAWISTETLSTDPNWTPKTRVGPKEDASLLGQPNGTYSKPNGSNGATAAQATATLTAITKSTSPGGIIEYKLALSGAVTVPSRFRFAYYVVQSIDSGVNQPISALLGQTVWLPPGTTDYKFVLATLSDIGLKDQKSVKVRAYVVAPDDSVSFAGDVTLTK